MAARLPRRPCRLELRLTTQERSILERAALLRTSGDLSRLVTAVAVDAARSIIREHDVTEITEQNREAFYATLLDSNDNPALAELFAKPAPRGYDL